MENHPYAIKITAPLTPAEKKQANKEQSKQNETNKTRENKG